MALNNDFKIKNGLTVNTTVSAGGVVEADAFCKHDGTSSQFLKADGSVDSAVYTTCTGTVVAGDISSFTDCNGTVTNVTTGPYLTGGGTSTPEIGIDSACAAKWDSASAGGITGVTAGLLLSGGGTSGSVTVGLDSGALTGLDQSACPGMKWGVTSCAF